MAIRVRFFASLREHMGYSVKIVSAEGIATVGDIFAQINKDQALTGTLLYAVNMEYAELDTPVTDGDEVAFFPPVTGGNS